MSHVKLEELLDRLAEKLGSEARADLHAFVLATVLVDLEKPGALTLGHDLHTLRTRLQRDLSELGPEDGALRQLVVDAIFAVDERSFWVVGWCRDEDGSLDHAEIVSPEGQRARVLEGAYRYSRPDVAESMAAIGIHTTLKHGYTKLIELPAPSLLPDGWVTELRTTAGGGLRTPAPPVQRDPVAARQTILAELTAEHADIDRLRSDHGYPALERLQAHLGKLITVENDVQLGEPPAAPEVSIVVPLYGRIDFVEHQLAQFWQDPEIAAAELIYVLDSPELAPALQHLAASLHELYGVPFRVITLNRNAGYAKANDLAVSSARGRLVLLLNSDVLPVKPGWLGRMTQFYDATPDIGALGVKLLYEDDSIQHAGMYFQWEPRTNHWENQHYFKGFSRALPAANVSRPVPAVTAACMMVDRSQYHGAGGLQEIYVMGGFEDSDLCLRLVEGGKRNWYLADVELYHLEAQSLPGHIRPANRYNAWLQTHLWNEQIGSLMRAQPEAADAHMAAVD